MKTTAPSVGMHHFELTTSVMTAIILKMLGAKVLCPFFGEEWRGGGGCTDMNIVHMYVFIYRFAPYFHMQCGKLLGGNGIVLFAFRWEGGNLLCKHNCNCCSLPTCKVWRSIFCFFVLSS